MIRSDFERPPELRRCGIESMSGMKDPAEIPLREKIQRFEALSPFHLGDGFVEVPSRVQEEAKAMARVVRVQLQAANKFFSPPKALRKSNMDG
jgi:hypothetical protein